MSFELSAASPLSPADALASFRLEPGLRAELVAAEPAVVSPCALAFDERGRMFVAENRGYPIGSPDGRPRGVIALLEDADGDGRFEKRSDFADGLTFPNGVLPWRGGVIVTCAPDVLWLADTNGDGRADVREVWLTGFDDKNTTQLRVSHPTLGPDGWIYLTSGWTSESTVRSPQFPDRPPVRIRTDSRFHPFTGELEPLDGRAQFGQTFDDFGRRFICYNRVHVQHVVGSSRFWKRNPNLAFAETVQNCPEDMVSDLLGSTENRAARLYPISDNLTTADSHAGTFTAACGVHVYRGDALPGYYGRIFACDPTGNLVHWDDLVPNGATVWARRSTNRAEFLASTDNWFRPVHLATGPDGALYICDMYRQTIEHPQYLPEEIRKRTDFEGGKDKGRIWRVRGQKATPGDRGSMWALSGTEELVKNLAATNGWQRDTAFRLLVERRSPDSVALLLNLLPSLDGNVGALVQRLRRAGDPLAPGAHLGRLNALNALLGIVGRAPPSTNDATGGKLEERVALYRLGGGDTALAAQMIARLIVATFDESPAVRAGAFRMLADVPGAGPELGDEMLLHWARDPSPYVRYQAALLLGNWDYGAALPALARLARRDGGDRWTRAAVLSGLKGRENFFFETLMRQTNGVPAPELMSELFRLEVSPFEAMLALTDADAGERLFGARQIRGESDAAWQLAGLAGLAEGLRARRDPAPKLGDFVDKPFGDQKQWITDGRHLRALLARATRMMTDPVQPLAVRNACVGLLAHEQGAEARPALLALLAPGQAAELQGAAVRALVTLPGDAAARRLIAPEQWQKFSPALRSAVLGALLSQPRHVATLLDALEQNQLPPAALSTAHRNALLKQKNAAGRERAERIFQKAGGDRMKVFAENKPALALKANPATGRVLFAAQCASCHRLDRVGVAVGPDLLGTRNQPKEAILLHVLVPNAEILPAFAAYQIETKDGRELNGLILAETALSITLRQAQGIDETIPRANIRSLTASAVSLMPDGFEQSMKPQDLADLLGYLKGEQE